MKQVKTESLVGPNFSTLCRIRHFCLNRGDPWRFHAEMWKVANSARLEMRREVLGNQPGNQKIGKMKD